MLQSGEVSESPPESKHYLLRPSAKFHQNSFTNCLHSPADRQSNRSTNRAKNIR